MTINLRAVRPRKVFKERPHDNIYIHVLRLCNSRICKFAAWEVASYGTDSYDERWQAADITVT